MALARAQLGCNHRMQANVQQLSNAVQYIDVILIIPVVATIKQKPMAPRRRRRSLSRVSKRDRKDVEGDHGSGCLLQELRGGQLTCEWDADGVGRVPGPVRHESWLAFAQAEVPLLSSVFLPEGYPESVTSDYLAFNLWDTLQAGTQWEGTPLLSRFMI
jgi:hypothetical protein